MDLFTRKTATTTKSVNPLERHDPFARHQMPLLELQHTHKKGKPVTIVVNLTEISESLKTNEGYLMEFFKLSLSTSKKDNILSGTWQVKELEIALDEFVVEFIQCKKCKTVCEIEWEVRSNKRVRQRCKACGHTTSSLQKSINKRTTKVIAMIASAHLV